MPLFPSDFKKFKHLESDEDTTTLQHPAGHKIIIAHKALNSNMKAQLNALPKSKAEKKSSSNKAEGKAANPTSRSDQGYGKVIVKEAKGGEINSDAKSVRSYAKGDEVQASDAPQTSNDQSDVASSVVPNYADPMAANQNEPPQQDQPQDQQQAPQQSPQSPAPMSQDNTQPEQPQQVSEQPKQNEAPAQEAKPVKLTPAEHYLLTKTATKNQLTQEVQALQHDIATGHITPETYGSLFAKKDTLGKIGTLFGLMLSGVGSGLTHQPNAVLELMQKQIDNDLHAQTTSKDNALNFLKLYQQDELNKANIKNMNADTQSKTYALAQAGMLQTSFHDLVSQVNKLPEGPQKQLAQQTLGMLYGKVGDRINNIIDQAAGAAAYNKLLFGQPSDSSNQEQQFQQKTTGMRLLGPQGEKRAEDLESKHYPGIQGQASAPLNSADREKLDSGIQFDQKLNRFLDWTKTHSGDLNPKDRHTGEALAAELQGAYRQATHGGVYKEGEQNFISKLIDSEPTKFFNNIRVVPQLKALSEENKSRIDQTAKNLGFQGYSKQSQPQQPQESVSKSGRPIIFQNGKWVYKK